MLSVTGGECSIEACRSGPMRGRGLSGVLTSTRITPATTGLRPIGLLIIRSGRQLGDVTGTKGVCGTPLTVVIYTSRSGT